MRCAWTGAIAAVLLGVGACRGGNAPEARPPAEPASAVGTPPPTSVVAADAGAPPEVAVDVGMPALAPVLDDPRLAAARARERDHDPSGARLGALDAARASVSLTAAQACAWAYVSGRLHLDAAETSEAAASFERALATADDAGTPCPLAPYAGLRDAQALLRLGRQEDAVVRLRAAGEDFGARDEARLALADALVMKGDRASALAVWRSLLATSPHGVRWADSSIQLAGALLDGVDGPPEAHAQEALDLATRVLVEAPMVAEKADLVGLRTRAAKALRQPTAPILTPDERVRQAQAWLDAAQPKRATETADALLEALPKGTRSTTRRRARRRSCAPRPSRTASRPTRPTRGETPSCAAKARTRR